MKLRHPNCIRGIKSVAAQRASVLVIVLWITLGLIAIALYFANSMTLELRASDNRASGLAADQAIEGAARYVSYILTQYATNGTVPDISLYEAAAVPVGNSTVPEENAHFWLIGRDPSGTPSTEPYFSLVDEASKLNLNVADSNTLSYLPMQNMTIDFADAITDWRDTNGVGSMNYAQVGYVDKNSPFETVDELRLVYGATADLLGGEDLNRNGVLDANEKDVNGNGQVDPGIFEYVTVYSREPNMHSDGMALTNATDQTGIQALLDYRLGASRSAQIIAQLFPQQSTGPRGRGGGPPTPPPPVVFSSMLQFYIRSGMTSTEFGQVAGDITINNAPVDGRVNINTASAPVLTALFAGLGVDPNSVQSSAQELVNYREQNAGSGNLGSIAWIVDALGSGNSAITVLEAGDYITAQSYQFTADIAALGPYGRGYCRVRMVFDISDGTPKIIYRQDLSRLGWALGKKVRETWVKKITQ